MLKYNLKISFRQLLKNKIFSIINIAGLVIGIMSFIVILQYIRFELNYDNFHKDAENVFRVRNDYYKGAKLDEMIAACPPPLAPALKDNFSEVEEYVRLLRGIRMVISNEPENTNFRSDDIYCADSSFFSVFSVPVSKGQVENALNTPNSTIITESFAKKTFGNSNPVGKMLRFKSRYFDFTCTVSSVLKDIPANSHLRFDALVSMSTYRGEKKSYGTLSDWSSPMYFTYLKLKPKSDPKELEAKLPAFVENRWNNPADGEHFKFTLERLNSIHLNKNKVLLYEEETTGKQSIYLLLVIAFIIIIIAWVNYINLSTAKALDRAKEVGVRKVSGANKRNLIGQFFLESILFNAISFLITFACIAIFVAYLGLFGLSYHTIRLRTKEIGIRKVNGARVLEVLILLNKDFVKWVALAFFLATPLTLLAIQKWLENYAYKTSLSLWIFVLAGGIAMCIALLTISLQSWKAASKNPIESLKYE